MPFLGINYKFHTKVKVYKFKLLYKLLSYDIIRKYLQFDKHKYFLDTYKSEKTINRFLVRFPFTHFYLNKYKKFKFYKLNPNVRKYLKILKKNNLVDFNFSRQNVEFYCNILRNLEGTRNPFPGFNLAVYSECNYSLKPPLVDYILKGQPSGPWLQQTITPLKSYRLIKKNPTLADIALHIHAFYLDEMLIILDKIPDQSKYPIDLFISCSSNQNAQTINNICSARNLKAHVTSFPNVGRDLGPLITGFRDDLQKYHIVGHLHTKKSYHCSNRVYISKWTNFLYSNLISSPKSRFPILYSIINEFLTDSSVGLIYPANPNIYSSESCYSEMRTILNRLNLNLNVPRYIDFPAGTMFWARREVLEPLFNLKIQWNDYPPEPLPLDGTILHAIERIFPILASAQGYRTAVTHTPGVCF